MTNSKSRQQYIERVNRATHYIHENMDQPVSLKRLAEVASFSEYHFHRVFTAVTGETPRVYVNRIRLEKAANLLLQDSLSITDIAMQCGFSSSAVFSRAFRNFFDCSPTEWQQGEFSKNCKADSRNGQAGSGIAAYAADSGEQSKEPAMELEVKQLDGFHVAYAVNREGYDDAKIEATWDVLLKWAKPRDLLDDETVFIGMPLDNPDITDEDKCRYYACITVPEGTETRGEIAQLDIGPGAFAVYRYSGPGEGVADMYRRIFSEWFPDSGYQPGEQLGIEIYHVDANVIEAAKANPVVDLDICIPVRPL